MKHQIGDDNPTKHDKPVLDQPPPLLRFVSYISFHISWLGRLLEFCKDIFCWSMIRHDPERQQEGEEPEDMEEQNNALSQWKMLREEDVEAHGEHDKQEDRHRHLPG